MATKYEHYIMFRKKLPDDPRVHKMSSKLRTNSGSVLGALVRLWILADDFANEDGRFEYTKEWIDGRVELPGFCDALPDDWLTEDEDGTLYLPSYQALNTNSTKARFEDAKRKRGVRKKTDKRPQKNGQNQNKGKERKGKEKDPCPASRPDEKYLSTAQWIFEKIKEMNPDHKEPNLERWANDIRLMHQQDKRTDMEIRNLFDWVCGDEFWRTNVLCPAALRKQWDRLTVKRNTAKLPKPKPKLKSI